MDVSDLCVIAYPLETEKISMDASPNAKRRPPRAHDSGAELAYAHARSCSRPRSSTRSRSTAIKMSGGSTAANIAHVGS